MNEGLEAIATKVSSDVKKFTSEAAEKACCCRGNGMGVDVNKSPKDVYFLTYISLLSNMIERINSEIDGKTDQHYKEQDDDQN